MYLVPFIALISAKRWRLDVLIFLIHGFYFFSIPTKLQCFLFHPGFSHNISQEIYIFVIFEETLNPQCTPGQPCIVCTLGVSPSLVSRYCEGYSFLEYLRTLHLKFQKAWTKIEVVLSLPCWLSQFSFWNFKLKVLKYSRNYSLHNTLIPWSLKKSWIT